MSGYTFLPANKCAWFERRTRMDEPPLFIRWMLRRDMPAVLAIEQQCFPFPWDRIRFLMELKTRWKFGLVAENAERILGYAVYAYLPDGIEIRNLAVHPKYHAQGVGAAIMAKLKSKLADQSRRQLLATIWERNADALRWFAQQGFVASGLEHAPYVDNDDDGINMIFRAEWAGK